MKNAYEVSKLGIERKKKNHKVLYYKGGNLEGIFLKL